MGDRWLACSLFAALLMIQPWVLGFGAERPDYCPSFGADSFDDLDTDRDGYLSAPEFQVHRDQMHGPQVPRPCHIPYDKGSYERLAGAKGMDRAQFAVHLQEMARRAAAALP